MIILLLRSRDRDPSRPRVDMRRSRLRRSRDRPADEPGLVADRPDVLGLRALLALGDIELDPLVLIEAAVARRVDGRVVDENVGTAAIWGDETETLLAVEPLHAALSHSLLPGKTVSAHRTARPAEAAGNAPPGPEAG
jgi:hypothetical protein